MANGHGGKRKGSGIPHGFKYPKTIEKAEARAIFERVLREKILAAAPEIIDAQLAHAKGVSYMTLRQPDGTYTRATDEKQLNAALAVGAHAFSIFTQAPNTQAFTALADRAFDKPAEQEQQHNVSGELVISWKKPAQSK